MKTPPLKRNDFLFLKNKGEKLKGRFFIVLFSPLTQIKGWGVIASKRVGNAVMRNYNKRLVREIIQKNDLLNGNPLKFVVICLPFKATFSQKEKDLVFLLSKIKMEKKYENN